MKVPSLHLHTLEFTFPSAKEPEWSSLVDRWYQLDAYAYGLTDLGWALRKTAEKPTLILLASTTASNESDFQFASQGASSAHRFAHTLPNVRASALCQAIDWHGPVLCFQKDPKTLGAALAQGKQLFTGDSIWVAGVHCKDSLVAAGTKNYRAYLIEFSDATHHKSRSFSIAELGDSDLNRQDNDLIGLIEKRFSH